jgi:hypothetical protein
MGVQDGIEAIDAIGWIDAIEIIGWIGILLTSKTS